MKTTKKFRPYDSDFLTDKRQKLDKEKKRQASKKAKHAQRDQVMNTLFKAVA